MEKKLFNWFFKEEKKSFDADQVKDLIEKIKIFNAGAIDQYLTNHVDKVFEEWILEKKEKKDKKC